MRFALIATTAAAVVAVPFALAAAGPRMTGDEFLAEVRCAAYEDVTGAEISAVRFQLNAESQQQPAATVAAARSQVSAIARQAVSSQTPAEHAMLRSQRAAACLNASLVADFGSGESLT